MLEKSYLTAFSDAVLSVTAIWGVLITQEKQYPILFKTSWPNDASFTATTLGFGCLAFASFLGFVRFAVLLPHQHELVSRMHKYFSFIGSCTGLPLLAAAYSLQSRYPSLYNVFLILGLTCPLLDLTGFIKREILRESASTLAVITILLVSTLLSGGNFNLNGTVGSVLFAVAGLAIGTEGNAFLRLRNIDLFHFVLAFGTVLLAAGL